MNDVIDEQREPGDGFEPARDLSTTPSMEQLLARRTAASGTHAVTDPTADPYETLRTAAELFDGRHYQDAAQLLEGLAGTPEGASREVRELLARSYYHSARLAKAADAARALLEIDPTNVDAATLLARSLERAAKPQEAEAAKRLARSLGADI